MVKCIFLSEQHCRFLDICQHLGAQLDIISCHINNITLNIVIITLLTLHYEVTTNIGTSLVPSKGLCCYCLFYVLQNPIKLPNINFRNSMRTCNVKDHFGQTTFKITTRTFTHSQSEYTSFLVTIFAVI